MVPRAGAEDDDCPVCRPAVGGGVVAAEVWSPGAAGD
jgi:hypothetical protein